MDAPSDPDPIVLQSILENLGREIRGPLDSLRGEIGGLLDDPTRPITEAERKQAQTLLTLCDDLGRLTRECLGGPDEGGKGVAAKGPRHAR
jgi:signal transduction histidine kinase